MGSLPQQLELEKNAALQKSLNPITVLQFSCSECCSEMDTDHHRHWFQQEGTTTIPTRRNGRRKHQTTQILALFLYTLLMLTVSVHAQSSTPGNSPPSSSSGGIPPSSSSGGGSSPSGSDAGTLSPTVGFGPTRGPTFPPSLSPTVKPTTLVPSFLPSLRPSLAPTSQPTPVPTLVATVQPSWSPTAEPSVSATAAPSAALSEPPTPIPSLRPSNPPTRALSSSPTRVPTRLPSEVPTIVPSIIPTDAPSLVLSATPTSIPTADPSVMPSPQPTASPSMGPTPVTMEPSRTAQPSSAPSMFPSNIPTDSPSHTPTTLPTLQPSPYPSIEPSTSPTLSLQVYTIRVDMVLSDTPGELRGGPGIEFESVTAAHIQQTIENINLKQEPLIALNVDTNIERQQVLNSPRRSRRLQSVQQLRIELIVQVEFRSLTTTYQPKDWIDDAFNSEDDRRAYVQRLKARNSESFQYLESVTSLLVDGAAPIEESVNASTSSGNDSVLIAAAAAGGGFAALLLIGVLYLRRGSSSAYGDGSKLEGEEKATDKSTQQVTAEILVEKQDDVSTLGDPVLPGGMALSVSGGDRDERTASVGDDYDYAKQYLMAQGVASVDNSSSRERLASLDSGRSSKTSTLSKLGQGPMGASVFSDDASFEQQFGGGDDENITKSDHFGEETNISAVKAKQQHPNQAQSNQQQQQQRLQIHVPPGRLGMVIDTPNGGIPVVHAIKADSILANQVRVGDYLVSVDNQDVTSMTAIQVSKMISLRSEQARVLVFVRNNNNHMNHRR